MQKLEKILERLGAYICDELCCHRDIGADKGEYAMQEICEKCELGGYLDDIRKRLSGASNSEIVRARAMSEAVRQGIIDGMSNPLQINGIQEWKERMLQNFMKKGGEMKMKNRLHNPCHGCREYNFCQSVLPCKRREAYLQHRQRIRAHMQEIMKRAKEERDNGQPEI